MVTSALCIKEFDKICGFISLKKSKLLLSATVGAVPFSIWASTTKTGSTEFNLKSIFFLQEKNKKQKTRKKISRFITAKLNYRRVILPDNC